jgi:GDP-4-dehydro-6-deoxy-D-mannose reductase
MQLERLLLFGTGFLAWNYVCSLQEGQRNKASIKLIYNHHKLNPAIAGIEHFSMTSSEMLSCIEAWQPTRILCLHGSSFVPAGVTVRESMEENSLKTMEFLELLAKSEARKKIKKILVIGSASEYGKCYNEAIRESFPLHATSLYGLSKISLYKASMYFYQQGLPVVYVRQFNTIGSTQRNCFVLPSFCRQVAEIEKGIREPKIRVGDLSQERDFLDVRDTCRAYSLLFEKGKDGEVYNVASGTYITIRQLLDVILEISRAKTDVTVVQDKTLFFKEQSLSRRLHGDISKISKLGFTPEISLNQTVKDTLDYWRQHV